MATTTKKENKEWGDSLPEQILDPKEIANIEESLASGFVGPFESVEDLQKYLNSGLSYDKEKVTFYLNIKDWLKDNPHTRLIHGEIRLYLTDSEGNKFYTSQKEHKDALNGLSSLTPKEPLKAGVYSYELQIRDNSSDIYTIETDQITIT